MIHHITAVTTILVRLMVALNHQPSALVAHGVRLFLTAGTDVYVTSVPVTEPPRWLSSIWMLEAVRSSPPPLIHS